MCHAYTIYTEYVSVIVGGREDAKVGSESLHPVTSMWYTYIAYQKNDWHLRPGSVVPTTALLLFLNPAVLVAMTTIL